MRQEHGQDDRMAEHILKVVEKIYVCLYLYDCTYDYIFDCTGVLMRYTHCLVALPCICLPFLYVRTDKPCIILNLVMY